MKGPKKQSREDLRRRLLVLRCQTGDAAAFAELFELFGPKTLRYLRGVLGAAPADDVQQEIWLTVFRRISGLSNPGAFRTWLYQITRHRALDGLRRQNRRDAILVEVPAEELDARPSPEPFDPSDVAHALTRLSLAHREVLILRYWEGLSYAEIATVVACSIGTVRSRIHHAKLNVRTILDKNTIRTEQ